MSIAKEDWWQHPVIRTVGKLDSGGLYTALGVAVLIGLLELVNARNERIWSAALLLGQLGVVAWIGSWAVIIVVGTVRWMMNIRAK